MFLDIKTFPNRWIRLVRGLCCFDHFLVFVLFCLIVFIQREGFSDSLHFVYSTRFSWLFFKHTERGLSKNQLG